MLSWQAVCAAVTLIAVLAGVVARPHLPRLARGSLAGRVHCWAQALPPALVRVFAPPALFAGLGALVLIALRLLTPRELLSIVGDTWDAAATLIALFLLSEALASNGFFEWAAAHLARFAGGSGWRLYALSLGLTTLVTALLANDGAVLMLTPIFAGLLTRIYPNRRTWLPYLFAVGFFADGMSALLLPSNLTNIIIADTSGLRFLDVFSWMALPTLCAFLAAGLAFGLRYRAELRERFEVARLPEPQRGDPVVFWLGVAGLAALIVSYSVTSQFHIPVSFSAITVALVLLIAAHLRGLRSAREIVAAAPWNILVYALGMFVVITAAYDHGVLNFLTLPLESAARQSAHSAGTALAVGGAGALLSAAVNNLPATLVAILSVRQAGGGATLAVYAMLLGVDIGPKLTPFGSLATLLWLNVLQRNKIEISWGEFLRANWWVTLLTLAAAFGGLLLRAAL